MKPINEQIPIVLKGVNTIVSKELLIEKLTQSIKNNKPLNVKLGLDPSAPDIHIGHAVVLRKIKQLQDLGHQITIIIGDFTGRIGDPTGKSKTRKALSDEEVKRNAQTYFEQIFKILDRDKTVVRYNSEWLSKLNFEDILKLASTTTVARMLERDDFQNRFNNSQPISLHEFFYPLMQAYDSIAIEADIELGGTDQTFNILMGRTLQKSFEKPQQIAIFMPILVGLDGVEKMSKSLGNYIGINEAPEVMFKKVMEVPDRLIIEYFTLATDIHPSEINEIAYQLDHGTNPRDIKLKLAREITRLYHNERDVEEAIRFYQQAFSKKLMPDKITELKIENPCTLESISDLLIQLGYIQSKSALRRLIQSNGVQVNLIKIDTIDFVLSNYDILKLGKKTFLKIITKQMKD